MNEVETRTEHIDSALKALKTPLLRQVFTGEL